MNGFNNLFKHYAICFYIVCTSKLMKKKQFVNPVCRVSGPAEETHTDPANSTSETQTVALKLEQKKHTALKPEPKKHSLP